MSQEEVDKHVGDDAFAFMTSEWNTSLTVVETGTSVQSLLSMSWPRGEGLGATGTPPWGVCAVAMPGLFDTLGYHPPAAATGNASSWSCLEMGMSLKCANYLMAEMLPNFDGYIDGDDGSAPGNATAACAKLAAVKISPFCFRGREGEEGNARLVNGT